MSNNNVVKDQTYFNNKLKAIKTGIEGKITAAITTKLQQKATYEQILDEVYTRWNDVVESVNTTNALKSAEKVREIIQSLGAIQTAIDAARNTPFYQAVKADNNPNLPLTDPSVLTINSGNFKIWEGKDNNVTALRELGGELSTVATKLTSNFEQTSIAINELETQLKQIVKSISGNNTSVQQIAKPTQPSAPALNIPDINNITTNVLNSKKNTLTPINPKNLTSIKVQYTNTPTTNPNNPNNQQ